MAGARAAWPPYRVAPAWGPHRGDRDDARRRGWLGLGLQGGFLALLGLLLALPQTCTALKRAAAAPWWPRGPLTPPTLTCLGLQAAPRPTSHSSFWGQILSHTTAGPRRVWPPWSLGAVHQYAWLGGNTEGSRSEEPSSVPKGLGRSPRGLEWAGGTPQWWAQVQEDETAPQTPARGWSRGLRRPGSTAGRGQVGQSLAGLGGAWRGEGRDRVRAGGAWPDGK